MDLEWACSFPVELRSLSYWLSGRPFDDMKQGKLLDTFKKVVTGFFEAFEGPETKLQAPSTFQAQIMRACWNRGGFWYFQAVHSPKGLPCVFNEHIQFMFCEKHCNPKYVGPGHQSILVC